MRRDLWLQVNINDVLQSMDCKVASPYYDEYVRACKDLIEQHQGEFRATGWMVLKGIKRADCLVMLEPSLDEEVKRLFERGEYLLGMLLNTIADHLLFDAVEKMGDEIAEVLSHKGLYLKSRKEPGCPSVALEEVALILDSIKRAYDVDIHLTEGFMMEPVKAVAHYYELDSNPSSFMSGEACSSCGRDLCNYRKVTLKVIDASGEKVHLITNGTNLLDALRRFGYAIEAPCGGRGICKKCKVELLTDQGLAWRYACQTEIREPLTIRLTHSDRGQVQADYTLEPATNPRKPMPGKVAFGVDIGTTTIVVQCLSMDTYEVLDEERYYNPQRPYGADVISRIQYEHESSSKVLTTLVRNKLRDSVKVMLTRHGKNEDDVVEIVVAGNTVMLYMLEGRDTFDLSAAPFNVEDPSRKTLNGSLFDLSELIKVTLMPVISAYVGGDIVSGFYASDFAKVTGNALYLDIGTNGEVALISNGRVVAASTAAGPAFEGANISCGVASIEGAVCELDYQNGKWSYVTIADKPPIGLNGSALIDLMNICRREGWVDETGYMVSGESIVVPLDSAEFLFSNTDVRQLQLAKAAIAAGIRCLMEKAGVSTEGLDAVYMAGGFGSHLNVAHAVGIGLLPKIFQEKVFVLGNCALAGTVRFLMETQGAQDVDELARSCDYIELSMHERFNELYIEEMFFP